jgi:hypothetical protein
LDMVYTIGKAVNHAKLLCSEAKSRYFAELGKLCVEDALVEFCSREWPWTHGEGVITTTAGYNTGTLTVTQGDATVTGVGTTWLTTWPSPAVIRIQGANGDEFLVTAITNGTELELDTEWPYDSDSGLAYTLEFPAYEIPNYIAVESVMSNYGFRAVTSMASYAAIMEMRRGWVNSGYPVWHAIIPGNGTTTTKLWISPSPSTVYTVRYVYRSAVPAFSIWDYGTATVSNVSASVTGSATHWDKTGITLPGNVFEISDPANRQDYVTGLVSASGLAAGALNLTAAWTGRDATNASYSISPQISIPDDMIPTFRTLVESHLYARIGKGDEAAFRRQIYQAMLQDAMGRYSRNKDFKGMAGVLGGRQLDADLGPGLPTEMTVRTV